MRRILMVGALLLALLLCPLLIKSALAALAAQELPLNYNGTAFELHADASGNLWVSDYWAGEIRKVSADGASYTVYIVRQNPGGPGDASPDNTGGVWWTDTTSVFHLNPAGNQALSWDVSASSFLWGVGVVSDTKVWLTDSAASNVYLFDSDSRDSCTYALPDGGQGFYPAVSGTQVWVGDTANGRLVRIDSSTDTNNLTWWPLPAGSSPYQVTLEGSGNVWYTDDGLGQLGRLTLPNQLRVYPLPPSQSAPTMLAASEGKIWYTAQGPASIGVLDPSQVSVTPQTAQPTTLTVTPSCSTLKLLGDDLVASESFTTTWTDRSYANLPAPTGWLVYAMPAGSQPNGIAVTTSGYVVDSLRQVLSRFSTHPPLPTLTLVKTVVKDNGGTAAATDWTLTATGAKTYSGSGGFTLDVDPGTYTLSESTGPAGYAAGAWSCSKNGGNPVSGSSISLALGDVATCTITNNDIPPILHLRKVVDNTGGGTALVTDWTLSAAGPTPLSGHTPVDSGAAFTAGTYTLSESGPTGYTASAWSCVKNDGAPASGSSITLAVGDTATCTITNTYISSGKPYKLYVPTVRR